MRERISVRRTETYTIFTKFREINFSSKKINQIDSTKYFILADCCFHEKN